MAETLTCDVLVVGSGAAGLAAAVTAAQRGARVVLAEKASVIGGTTAWSGGWIWAPCNPVAHRAGITEDPAEPRRYLEAVQGNHFNPTLVDAFLTAAPQMVEFFETHTALHFDCGAKIPDTYSPLPGAGMGGRSVIAQPYDGRALGPDIALLRKPLAETSFWGMTIQAGPDLRAFLTATRSLPAAIHVAKRLGRHLYDLALHGRGMQLRNGNALVARLLRSALDLKVDIRVAHPVSSLTMDGPTVTGATLTGPHGPVTVQATATILAAGGYPQDLQRRATTFPDPDHHRTLAVAEATGDGLRLGEQAGGQQTQALAAPGAWCPVSHVLWPDGREGTFPHIIDRGKPGVIGVLADGNRFTNEGLGYHDYVLAMQANGASESWLVCDHRFLRRYGLGIVRPAPVPPGPWIKSGYLKTGATPRALAQECGIDPAGLAATLDRFNTHAAQGEDPEFRRGSTPYMRLQGDPDQQPNPCLAPITRAPYYAVKVVPGSFGTFAGLRTDGHARVLDAMDKPIPGLYAAGTDMASVMGGHYPAGGINLGPALTFGFIAGRHATGADT